MEQKREDSRDTGALEGRYANYFKIGYNAFEFLLDCGQLYPESKEPQIHTRIITSPIYAKALLATLKEAIDQYEQAFGAIKGSEEVSVSETTTVNGSDNIESVI